MPKKMPYINFKFKVLIYKLIIYHKLNFNFNKYKLFIFYL